jgi:hypothetical protein
MRKLWLRADRSTAIGSILDLVAWIGWLEPAAGVHAYQLEAFLWCLKLATSYFGKTLVFDRVSFQTGDLGVALEFFEGAAPVVRPPWALAHGGTANPTGHARLILSERDPGATQGGRSEA